MALRPYQEECLNAILKEYVTGCRQQLVAMATGTGKTVVFSNLRNRVKHLLSGKMLVFAHREELVDQAVESLQKWNPDAKVGKEMAEHYADADCDIIVSCVASIGRVRSERIKRFGEFDIVVSDECHHSIAQTYLNVFEHTGVLKEGTNKLLVGFTATPKRHDRVKKTEKNEEEILSLKSVYKKVVYSYPIRKAIKEGWLVPLKGFRLKTDTSLDNVKITAGDYQQDQLTDTINTDVRNGQILKSWLQHGEGRQTVGFTSGIAHAIALADLFKRNGVKAEAVWGTDPDRAEKLAKHKRKEITVLFNAQVLTEGYDDWQVSCIITAAPTTNSSKYTQEIGRGTRLQEGTGNLLDAIKLGYALSKVDCYIIDVVDNSKKCSLVTLPSLVGLNPEMDLNGGSVTEAAEKMEEMEEKYPTVDLSHLTDLSKVEVYLESIDMFASPFSEEVKDLSKLSWVTATDGSYILSIPEKKELKGQYARYLHEKLHIKQNELDEYELSITTTSSDRKLGTFATLKEAFETADDVVRRCRSDRMKLLTREEEWRNNPASEPVKRYLRTLTKKKPILKCVCAGPRMLGSVCGICKQLPISAGEASIAIDILKNKKK